MLTLEIAQNTFVFMALPYPFSNVVLLRFKRTPFRLQKESFCNAKRTLLTLTDFTLHFSCCFTKLLHSHFIPLLNNFTCEEKCY